MVELAIFVKVIASVVSLLVLRPGKAQTIALPALTEDATMESFHETSSDLVVQGDNELVDAEDSGNSLGLDFS